MRPATRRFLDECLDGLECHDFDYSTWIPTVLHKLYRECILYLITRAERRLQKRIDALEEAHTHTFTVPEYLLKDYEEGG